MKEWWRPLSAIVGALTFLGIFFIVPMSTKIDSLEGEKADTLEMKECLDKKADQDVFDLTVTNIQNDVEELKEGQKVILREIRKINGGGQ